MLKNFFLTTVSSFRMKFTSIIVLLATAYPLGALGETVYITPRCQAFLEEIRAAPTSEIISIWELTPECQTCDMLLYVSDEMYSRPNAKGKNKLQLMRIAADTCFRFFGR